jgi:hypothetical protein
LLYRRPREPSATRYRCIAQPEHLLEPQHTSLIRRIATLGLGIPSHPRKGARLGRHHLPRGGDAKAEPGCRKRRNRVPDWSEIRCRFPPKSPAAFDRNQVPVSSDFCTASICSICSACQTSQRSPQRGRSDNLRGLCRARRAVRVRPAPAILQHQHQRRPDLLQFLAAVPLGRPSLVLGLLGRRIVLPGLAEPARSSTALQATEATRSSSLRISSISRRMASGAASRSGEPDGLAVEPRKAARIAGLSPLPEVCRERRRQRALPPRCRPW